MLKISAPPRKNLAMAIPGNVDEYGLAIHSKLIPEYPFAHDPIEFKIKRELVIEKELSYEEWIEFCISRTNKDPAELQYVANWSQIAFNSFIIKPYTEDYKIHLNFKFSYLPFVIDRIIEYRYCFPKRLSFKFLIDPLSLNQVNKTWQIFPSADALFSRNGVDVDEMSYSEESSYSNHLTPSQLKSIPIYQGPSNTYDLDSRMYKYEYLLLPRVVFYVLKKDIKQTLSALLELFPDNKVDELVQAHDYPRLNIRVSKMIYIADGSADDKINSIRRQSETDSPISFTRSDIYDLPVEYIEKQRTCRSQPNPIKCNEVNTYSRYFSDNDICQWNDDSKSCTESDTYSHHLLFKRNPDGSPKSIQEFFKEIGQEELYNFGGNRQKRRSTCLKRNMKLNTKTRRCNRKSLKSKKK
jgi:hypothetical protein